MIPKTPKAIALTVLGAAIVIVVAHPVIGWVIKALEALQSILPKFG